MCSLQNTIPISMKWSLKIHPVTDRNSKAYKETRTPNYTIEIFKDVGRAVNIALLEFA